MTSQSTPEYFANSPWIRYLAEGDNRPYLYNPETQQTMWGSVDLPRFIGIATEEDEDNDQILLNVLTGEHSFDLPTPLYNRADHCDVDNDSTLRVGGNSVVAVRSAGFDAGRHASSSGEFGLDMLNSVPGFVGCNIHIFVAHVGIIQTALSKQHRGLPCHHEPAN